MIRIKLSQSKLDEICKEHFDNVSIGILKEIKTSLEDNNISKAEKKFYRTIRRFLCTIICAKPADLEQISDRFIIYYDEAKKEYDSRTNLNFKEKVLHVFSYENFSKNRDTWGAYKFCKELKVNVCPYCNRSYIHIVDRSKKSVRPEIDHFYPKYKYPFFALSFYNLIPSCNQCNSRLKRTRIFKHSTHVNPYVEDYEEAKLFTYTYTSVGEINIYLKDGQNSNKSIIKKAKRNIETFLIEDLYNRHTDYVQELIEKKMIYTNDKIQELFEGYDGAFNSKTDIERLIFSNYTNKEDLDKRPLAKLTRDIINEIE